MNLFLNLSAILGGRYPHFPMEYPNEIAGAGIFGHCAALLRACARSALGTLQLNCVAKEELLDVQIHPEEHQNLIIRICGFSVRFTSLSPEWQQEVFTRNFYD